MPQYNVKHNSIISTHTTRDLTVSIYSIMVEVNRGQTVELLKAHAANIWLSENKQVFCFNKNKIVTLWR